MSTTPDPIPGIVRHVEPVRPDAPIVDAIRRLVASGLGGLPVVDAAGRLVGFLDETHCLTALLPGYLRELHGTGVFLHDTSALARHVGRVRAGTVADHMDPAHPYVDVDDSEMHAGALFLQHGVTAMAVIDAERRVTGVLCRRVLLGDLIHRFADGPPPDGAT